MADGLGEIKKSIKKAEHDSGIVFNRLIMGYAAFTALSNEADPPMTKSGIEAALGLKLKVMKKE